jgi:DNA phosphorothioation-dependent restriction protein DptG
MSTTTAKERTDSPFYKPYAVLEELSEQVMEGARKTGERYLDSWQQIVSRAIKAERRLADSSRQQWLKEALQTHADISQDLLDAYTSAAHSLLKV